MVINPKRLDRAIEAIAQRTVRNGKWPHPSATVSEIKLRAQKLLARGLGDQDRPLCAGTVAKARWRPRQTALRGNSR
jgi:hypothetical protein